MVRPALELAWAVAKVGSQARPPLPVPGRLRPLMKASRLPDRMLNTVREVVDADDAFRGRVRQAADEELLGRASWLWLMQPDGWEAELSTLVEEAGRAEDQAEEKKSTRATQRQLEEATGSLQKARAELASAQNLNSQLEVELSAARKARREADAAAARVRAALEEAVAGQEALRGAAAELTTRMNETDRERNSALEEVSRAEADLQEARRQLDVVKLALAESQRQAASAATLSQTLLQSLEDVFTAARDVAASAGIEAALADSAESAGSAGSAGSEGSGESPPRASAQAESHEPTATAARRRTPARLPPAVFDESPEAARHLVRLPGSVLVVDGYNVTLSSWPDADLPMQRRRLVDSLAEFVMRAGTEVVVIFDGVDEGNYLQLPASTRGRMRVGFTASETEADEVIIDLVDSLPIDRTIVVATNDRRVRDTVVRRGANVISVDQLLAVIGRGSDSPA